MFIKLTKGAGLLSFVYAAGEAATLFRTVIFAHWLGPAEMGLLVLLQASLRLIELITDVSIERLMLQARDGASRRFLARAHAAGLIRGAAGALLLLAGAIGFRLPLSAMAGLALVPVARGFQHLEVRIHGRHLNPALVAVVEGAGSLGGLLAALPAVILWRGPEAVVFTSLAQAGLSVLASHLLARRPWRAEFDGESLMRFWRYGWPLILNGLVTYAIFQGERMGIAASLGLAALGHYAIASQFAFIPAMLAGRVATSAFLPPLARGRSATGRLGLIMLYGWAAAGLVFTLTFAILGPWLIAHLFGPDYHLPTAVLGWLGAIAGLRFARTGPVLLMLALGDSRGLLSGTFLRFVALGAGMALALSGRGLEGFVIASALGEALCLAIALHRLAKPTGHPRAMDAGLLWLCAAIPLMAALFPGLEMNAGLALGLGLLGIGLALMRRPRALPPLLRMAR